MLVAETNAETLKALVEAQNSKITAMRLEREISARATADTVSNMVQQFAALQSVLERVGPGVFKGQSTLADLLPSDSGGIYSRKYDDRWVWVPPHFFLGSQCHLTGINPFILN